MGRGEGILISPGVMFEGIHMDKCSLLQQYHIINYYINKLHIIT